MTDALPIGPERLLEETRWLQSLARHLAGPDDADDLAQAAWLRAIEQAPERIRGLRPWLRTVLRNAFRRSRTDHAARLRRETAAARSEALPSAAELTARTSLHRAVADAVLALDEPARSTVILRFFEDRKPQEIARLQNIAVATVHTRLRRALAILRARLDRERGGRDAWVALACPVTAVSAAATKGALLGGIAMTATTKAGIGAACTLLIALGVVLTWKSPEPPPVREERLPVEERKPEIPAAASAPVTKITPRDSVAEAEPTAAPAQAPTPATSPRPDLRPKARGKGALEGRILIDPFVPMSLVAVEVSRVSGPLAPYPTVVHLDRQGGFTWPVDDADPLRVTVGATGVDEPVADVSPIAVRPDEITRDSRLDPLDLRGRLRLVRITVVDGDAAAVDGAVVYVEPREGGRSEYGVTTAKEGIASLVMTAGGVDLRVEAAGFRTERARSVSGDTRVTLRRGPRIAFRFDRDLARLPRATVPQVRLLRVPKKAEDAEDGPPIMRRVVLADGRIRTTSGGRNTLSREVAAFKLDSSWGPVEVAVPEPGTFEVQLSLGRSTKDGGGALSVEYPPKPRIVVEDHDRLQQISCLAPPDAAVTKTLKQLDESIRK